MDAFHCPMRVNEDGELCGRPLVAIHDGQRRYCACHHWHAKQLDPEFAKLCNDYHLDAKLDAVRCKLLDAYDELHAGTHRPEPERKALAIIAEQYRLLVDAEEAYARERQHPGILAREAREAREARNAFQSKHTRIPTV